MKTQNEITDILRRLRDLKVFNRYNEVDVELIYYLCDDAAEVIEQQHRYIEQLEQLIPNNFQIDL